MRGCVPVASDEQRLRGYFAAGPEAGPFDCWMRYLLQWLFVEIGTTELRGSFESASTVLRIRSGDPTSRLTSTMEGPDPADHWLRSLPVEKKRSTVRFH